MADGKAFVNRELFRSIQPVVVITRLVGLCPVAYEQKGSGFLFRRSLKRCVASYFLAIALAISTIWGVLNDLRADPKDSIRMQNPTTKYITCCDISVIIFTVLLGVIATPFKLRDLWKAFECFQKTDLLIPCTRTDGDRKRSILAASLTLVLFTLLVVFDMTTYDKLLQDQNQTVSLYLRNYVTFYCMYYIVLIQEFYYWHLVNLIRRRLEGLNEFLESKRKGTLRNNVYRGLSLTVPKGIASRFGGFESDLGVDDVLRMTKGHELICEAIEAVNDWFGFSVLLIMLSCLLHLVVTPYFLLMEIKHRKRALFIALQFSWTVTHILRLLVIVEPCHSCLRQNQKTINLVFKSLACELKNDVKSQLSTFAWQIKYRKIRFSPCGLITIDRFFLSAVAGSVTTYLVILFQFGDPA